MYLFSETVVNRFWRKDYNLNLFTQGCVSPPKPKKCYYKRLLAAIEQVLRLCDALMKQQQNSQDKKMNIHEVF